MKEQLINWLNAGSEDFQFILFGLLLAILITLEYLVPFRRINQKRNRRWFTNFYITTLNIVLISTLPVSFISASLYAGGKEWGLLNQLMLPFNLILLVSLLLRGFISFFTHLLMHKVGFLWRIHRVHHLDTELDISTTVRFHPLEFIINLMIGIPLVILFGIDVWALMLYELLDILVTMISHTNISLPRKVEYVLRYIIVTPDLHRVHHSSCEKQTNSNYSAVFPVWDIIFKTFRILTRKEQKTMTFGLEEVRDNRTNNLTWLLKSPLEDFNNAAKIELSEEAKS